MVLSFGIENITKEPPPSHQNIKMEEMEDDDEEENIQVDDDDDSNHHQPRHHQQNHQSHSLHHLHSPAPRLTNFSISEILKPDFGVRKISQSQPFDFSFSAFSPLNLGVHNKLGIKCTNSPSPSPTSSCDSAPSSPERIGANSTSPGTENRPVLWPAWVYCTRYSDRPSSGPRSRKIRKKEKAMDEKRPRTAFTNDQLQRLKREFEDCRYLTEQRRTDLARELNLTEAQIKIWFQNKRAKIKKTTSSKNTLALSLMAQGLYNHSTVCVKEENEKNAMETGSPCESP